MTALDAVTRNVIKTYQGSEFTSEVLFRDGVLLLSVSKKPQRPGQIAQSETAARRDRVLQGPATRKEVVALKANGGQLLWRNECGYWAPYGPPDIFVIDGLVWSHAADRFDLIGVDLASGEIRREFSTQSAFDEVHHHRCYRNKATQRYLLTARRGIEFLNLKTEQCQALDWVRGRCRYGIMPCNGLLYVPPHPCQCYITEKLNGFFAFTCGQTAKDERQRTKTEDRLEEGPAYHNSANRKSRIRNSKFEDWPTYRHDIHRSGSTKSKGPVALKTRWRTDVGGRPSACTITGDTVYL